MTNRKRYLIYAGFILGYLVLSWILHLVFNPYNNLISRFFLFTLFLLPLAILIRFDDNRVVIVVTFILINLLTGVHVLFFPQFYAILTPLFPVFHEYQQFFPYISSYNESARVLLTIVRFGYLIDLVIVLTLAGLVSLGSRFVNRVGTKTGKAKGIYSILLVVIVILLLVLPYLVILSTGVMHFGLAYSSGAIQLQQGVDSVVTTNNLSLARPFFVEAAEQYELAQHLFEGLNGLQLKELLLLLDPSKRPLVENGELLLQASFLITDLLLPIIDGIILMEHSFSDVSNQDLQASEVANASETLQVARTDFLQAQVPLILALSLLAQVNIEEFSRSTKVTGIGDYSTELELLQSSGLLFNSTLDLLLIQLQPIFEYSFPLDHALQAIFQTRKVQQQIGNTSRYAGVIPRFVAIRSNLSIVDLSLNPALFPEFNHLENLDLGKNNPVDLMRADILGLFDFLRDLVSIGISLSQFGISVAKTLITVNSTLLPLSSDLYQFPNIPDESLRQGEVVLAQLQQNATTLQQDALEIESQIGLMNTRSRNGGYGIFSSQAILVVAVLQSFELLTNANNFYHLVSASLHLVQAIREFQSIESHIKTIEGNLTQIENNPSDTDIIQEASQAINSTIIQIEHSLAHVRSNLSEAEFHLDQIKNMPEAILLKQIVQDLRDQIALLDQVDTGNLDQLQELVSQLEAPVDPQILEQLYDQLDQINEIYADTDEILSDINIPISTHTVLR